MFFRYRWFTMISFIFPRGIFLAKKNSDEYSYYKNDRTYIESIFYIICYPVRTCFHAHTTISQDLRQSRTHNGSQPDKKGLYTKAHCPLTIGKVICNQCPEW